MSNFQKLSLFLLRITTGWLLFYAGLTKLMNPTWSAASYLTTAKTFSGLYGWLASPSMLPFVDFINEWGLTLIGAALILGIFVRFSGIAGAILMLLYYFPVLEPGLVIAHGWLVDEHIIYAAGLLTLASWRAGRVWGLGNCCANLPSCANSPKLRRWLAE